MYKVSRENGKVVILDWQSKVVFSTEPSALLVYEGAAGLRTDEVGKLTDQELLLALAKAVKLAI